MTGIETNHPLWERWLGAEHGWVARLRQHLRQCQAHEARSVVLVPYAQLIPVARRMWQQAVPNGFAPRMETTQTWARSVAAFVPQGHDLAFDRARDLLTAQALLDAAGLAGAPRGLSARLLDAVYGLAPVVASRSPPQRNDWAAKARAAATAGMEHPALALESALARLALEWAVVSNYATDTLFAQVPSRGCECLMALVGFQPEPLTQALLQQAGAHGLALPLSRPAAAQSACGAGGWAVQQASDPEDEAERAAACVLVHLRQGRQPVALAATDRVLVRRIRAMLDLHGVRVRDETGWKLSTTRAAAHVMGALRAARWDASGDTVLDWLKNAPALDANSVSALERLLRQHGLAHWRALEAPGALQRLGARGAAQPALQTLLSQVQTWRASMVRARPLAAWLAQLQPLLVETGIWAALVADAAGQRLIEVLRLEPTLHASLDEAPGALRRLPLSDFCNWVDQVLEAASFVPPPPADEQVVIVPLSQLLARPMAALVLAGCDEQRLNPSVEPPGDWTVAQRLALGLPSRELLAAAQRAAWFEALHIPFGDLIWRRQDEAGEPVLPSPLVQILLATHGLPLAVDGRESRRLPLSPVSVPQPHAQLLPVHRIAATAYEDLRRCPYRFFALRMLGLRERDELESPLDKRDFGLWLHEVLKVFHDALQAAGSSNLEQRRELLDQTQQEVSARRQLDAAEFLPFAAAWPRLRDGYLHWLGEHEAAGARFLQGEHEHQQGLGSLQLFGKIDRVDLGADGWPYVLDYKTESQSQTTARLQEPLEDTQLAFYAALLPHDQLRAAYVNVGERTGSKTCEQPLVLAARDALVEGLMHDLQRINAGAALSPLGAGVVCERCAARGLCRKDFWAQVP